MGGIVLAVIGAGSGAAAVASSSGNGTTYIPQLGISVPNDKLVQYEHAIGNYCYPKKCAIPRKILPEPKAPSGPIAPVQARLINNKSEIPVSPGMLTFTNGWFVNNGKTLVAIYAGAAGNNPSDGRLVILRQNELLGTQTLRIVNVPGAGALTIVSAPLGASVETTAQRAAVSFRSSTGARGTFNLGNGKITVNG